MTCIMNRQAILDELLGLLEKNGVEVRTAALGGGAGGLCQIRGKYTFFVDTESSPADMAAVCAQAVAAIVDVEKVYLRPEVREFVEKYGHEPEK